MSTKTEDYGKYWPLRSIENNCIVSKTGDITVCYEVLLPEIYTLSANVTEVGEIRTETGDFRELVEIWGKALGVLPEHVMVHKQDFFTKETYDQSTIPDGEFRSTFLDKASTRHFHERPYLNHRCYLYISKTAKKSVSTMQTSLVSGRFLPKEISDPAKLDEFFSALAQFESIINSTRKITLRRLVDNELYHADKPGILERYMSLEVDSEIVPLCDIRRGEELMVGDKIVKFFSLSDIEDMPDSVFTHNVVSTLSTENSTLAVGFASPVGLMLDIDHVYNQYIFIDDKKSIFTQLEARATQMTALGSFTKANAVNAAKITDFLTYAADTGFSPIRCHFNIMVWTNDKSELPQLRNKTNAAIAKMGIRPRENSTYDSLGMFWAGIPGNAGDVPDEDKFWTFVPQAICLLNEESVSPNSYSAVGIRVTDRLSGKPLYVDFSDEPMKRGWVTNRNKFILGPSGSGKSFLTNHFLRSYFIQGAHMVIVDVGDSYEGLCSMLKGKYLTYKPEAPITFNPFHIEGRRKPDIEKIESLKALLLSLWKKEEENLTRLEETALSLAVNGYFDHLEVNQSVIPSFNTFFEYLKDSEAGFKKALDTRGITPKMFDYDGFIVVMEPFYRGGEYDYLLNSETNLDLTNERFIVFELDNIKDNKILFPVVTIIIMDTFITKMRTLKGIRKIILIEEAWKAIMKEQMAEYIKYLYKTVRKHFGEAWIVTQEIDDIIGNKIVKDSIINNADTRILMDQRKYMNKFDQVKALMSLTDQEKNLALSINRDLDPTRHYKEFLVSFAGQKSLVYGLEVSREEYLAFTTEQSEKFEVQNLVLQSGGNYDLGIRTYMETHTQ